MLTAKRIKELKFVQGTAGKNFRTTLDIEVQKFASELLKDKSGSICVMDIYTGVIIVSWYLVQHSMQTSLFMV